MSRGVRMRRLTGAVVREVPPAPASHVRALPETWDLFTDGMTPASLERAVRAIVASELGGDRP